LITVRQLDLPRTPKREARQATLEIREQRVRLKAPYRKHTTLPNVEINVVLVRETSSPSDEEAVEWLLITTLPISTAEEVLLVVDYYTGRWPIEVFFRVFKSGCQVERIQLETSARLLPCLMLYKIVAWRVLYLTVLGRECPELPSDMLFTADEWKPVWKITSEEPIPRNAPNLRTFLSLLAQLGGRNGRRKDGPPGPQSLWIGIRRMTDFAIAWRAFGPDNHTTSPIKRKTRDTCVIIQKEFGNDIANVLFHKDFRPPDRQYFANMVDTCARAMKGLADQCEKALSKNNSNGSATNISKKKESRQS